jgi:hypothetical protein
MKCQCPNKKCRQTGEHRVIFLEDRDNPPHAHLECIFCGYHFNKWLCNEKVIKKEFKEIYQEYL